MDAQNQQQGEQANEQNQQQIEQAKLQDEQKQQGEQAKLQQNQKLQIEQAELQDKKSQQSEADTTQDKSSEGRLARMESFAAHLVRHLWRHGIQIPEHPAVPVAPAPPGVTADPFTPGQLDERNRAVKALDALKADADQKLVDEQTAAEKKKSEGQA